MLSFLNREHCITTNGSIGSVGVRCSVVNILRTLCVCAYRMKTAQHRRRLTSNWVCPAHHTWSGFPVMGTYLKSLLSCNRRNTSLWINVAFHTLCVSWSGSHKICDCEPTQNIGRHGNAYDNSSRSDQSINVVTVDLTIVGYMVSWLNLHPASSEFNNPLKDALD